jgi:hypothetical protein
MAVSSRVRSPIARRRATERSPSGDRAQARRVRARLDDVVLDAAVGPRAVAADRVHTAAGRASPSTGAPPRERAPGDVDVGRVQHDVVLGDQLVAVGDACTFEVGEDALAGIGVDSSRVVDARAGSRSRRTCSCGRCRRCCRRSRRGRNELRREVHPVHALGALAVEAEVEDEHLVPAEVFGLVRDAASSRGASAAACAESRCSKAISRFVVVATLAFRSMARPRARSSAMARRVEPWASALTYWMAPPAG